MKSGNINVDVDRATKTAAESVLSKLGLAPTDAVRLFYRQIILRRGLPFAVEIPNKKTLAALKELDAGRGKKFRDNKSFYKDLGIKDKK